MAVVQISKIQVRRGKKNTSGMPQLASGELAWAIDTQELFIGNGSVGEGAPAVGNTKILTEHDNIIDLLNQYSYKPTDSTIASGLPGPTERTLQERLDEGAVNAKSFGIDGSYSTVDQTALIQNAIWSLYDRLNPTTNRVNLEFDPGTYRITGTIYIPRNMGIIGAGSGRTVFEFAKGGINTGTTLTLSGTSVTTPGTYSGISSIDPDGIGPAQPQIINVSGTGSGLVVNVTKTGTGTSYTNNNTTITIVNSGSGYAHNDQIKILGSALGGSSPANDLTITLSNTKTAATDYPTFGTSKVFEFVGGNSTRATRDQTIGSTGELCQNVFLYGFKVSTTFVDHVMPFDIRNVIESQLEDIDCVALPLPSTVQTTVNSNSIAFNLFSSGSVSGSGDPGITCRQILFKGVKARGFSYGVYADTDIVNNLFDHCIFEKLYNGVAFGVNAGVNSAGPVRNTISNSTFREIAREGIIVGKGYGNRSRGNTFTRVGNNGGSTPLHPVIKFNTAGNSSIQDNFDRNEIARYSSTAYTPEVEGFGLLQETMPSKISFAGLTSSPTLAFRLPLNDAVSIEVKYVWRSNTLTQMRKGTLHIAVDRDRNSVQLVDEYEYNGPTGDDTRLSFTGTLGPSIGGVRTVDIMYTYTNPVGDNTFSYTYTILS